MNVDRQLWELIEPVVKGLGYDFWGVQFVSHQGRNVLRVFIDKEGAVDVDDCARVSHQLSGVLDVEDPVKMAYDLEVSSPGLDRLLFTEEHFRRSRGAQIKVRVRHAMNGRRNFSGELVRVDSGEIAVVQGGEVVAFPIDEIESARLVPEL